jgi:hypothetical protein
VNNKSNDKNINENNWIFGGQENKGNSLQNSESGSS